MRYLIFISILLFSFVLLADDCGVPLDCPAGKRYPYTFCNTATSQHEPICTDDPLGYTATHPNLLIRKTKLPICPAGVITTSMVLFFNKYRDGENEITLVGDNALKTNIAISREFAMACEKWNCVCGYSTYPCDGGSTIKIKISYESKDFPPPLNPKTVLAYTDDPAQGGYGECYLDADNSMIYFNMTPDFLYGQKDFPELGTPLKKGWVTQDNLGNANLVPGDVKLFSFLQTAIHELGHILGFHHYNNAAGGDCDGDLSGIMKYDQYDIRDENMTELSDDDKCMMAKLYCPDLIMTSIYNYEEQGQKIYPNPGKHVISIEFEIEKYSEGVTIYFANSLGRMVFSPIENKTYSAGLHKEEINVDGLQSGAYYVIVDTGIKKVVMPLLIRN